jgi:hypothetical protein
MRDLVLLDVLYGVYSDRQIKYRLSSRACAGC